MNIELINLDAIYESFTGAFVLLDINSGQFKIYNDSLSNKRYSPCSTFKVPNSLIGIESGIAEDENFLIEYDSIKPLERNDEIV